MELVCALRATWAGAYLSGIRGSRRRLVPPGAERVSVKEGKGEREGKKGTFRKPVFQGRGKTQLQVREAAPCRSVPRKERTSRRPRAYCGGRGCRWGLCWAVRHASEIQAGGPAGTASKHRASEGGARLPASAHRAGGARGPPRVPRAHVPQGDPKQLWMWEPHNRFLGLRHKRSPSCPGSRRWARGGRGRKRGAIA